MAEPIEMQFGSKTQVGPGNHVLDWGQDPPWEGAIFRGKAAHYKVWGHSVVTCAKMAEPIVMPFGLWARTCPRNHELDGDRDPP